jgi:hypothetical protein
MAQITSDDLIEEVQRTLDPSIQATTFRILRASVRENLTEFVPEIAAMIIDLDEVPDDKFIEELMAPITSIVIAAGLFADIPDAQKGFRGLSHCVARAMGDQSATYRRIVSIINGAHRIVTEQDLTLNELVGEDSVLKWVAVPLAVALACHGQTGPQVLSRMFDSPGILAIANFVTAVSQDIATGHAVGLDRISKHREDARRSIANM